MKTEDGRAAASLASMHDAPTAPLLHQEQPLLSVQEDSEATFSQAEVSMNL